MEIQNFSIGVIIYVFKWLMKMRFFIVNVWYQMLVESVWSGLFRVGNIVYNLYFSSYVIFE